MVQTESILLKTAAQVALLPSAKLSSSSSELPGISTSELSIKGKKKYEEIKRHVDFEQNGNKTLISIMMDNIWSWVKKFNKEESPAEIGHTKEDSLGEFLNTYKAKYRKIFKSLAAMDSIDMFTTRTRKDQDSQDPHSKSVWRTVRDMVWQLRSLKNLREL
ncbi:hypothetical protein SUGI_0708070 [Cryptomeria japonica]|nr:hypothetical protein SUGI_0708070 [Cryptomeria japonica]